MRRRHGFLDDDCFPDWDSDFGDYDIDIDSLAETLDLDLDFRGIDFSIDTDSLDLDGLNDFD